MKKLLILTAVAMMSVSSLGCHGGTRSWCNRGTTCYTPCTPAATCGPCGGASGYDSGYDSGYGDTYLGSPTIDVMPGPVTN